MQIDLGLRLGTRQVGGSFSPASLFAAGEQGGWYDPSDLSTLFQDTAGTVPVTATGQTVARINDKSGRGNHLTQATAASRPQYQIDANGLPYLLFDGTDDWFISPTITPGIDKAQVFAGVRKLSDAARGMLWEMGVGFQTGSTALQAPSTNGVANYGSVSGGTLFASSNPTGFPAPITNVVSVIADIAADNLTTRVNGVVAANNTSDQGTGNYLAYPLYVGRRGGTGLPFNGRLYALAVRFGANLSSDQIAQMEAWVNQRTGAF